MSEQTPLGEALAIAAENASVMAYNLRKAVRLVTEQAATAVASATADQPEKFTHTDGHGDGLVVGPMNYYRARYGVLFAEFTEDPSVHLDQDAVNRLAQYLDRYRTDRTPCGTEGDKPSPAMENDDLTELCAGHLLDGPSDSSGCAHSRRYHGIVGCVVTDCPCVRRNGK